MSATLPERVPAVDRDHAQRRTLGTLVTAQLLSGAGLSAGVVVGALLAQDMLGATTLTGLPSALLTGGSAVAAVLVGRLSQRSGRRPGLAAGYLAGALGAVGVVIAATLDSPVLFFAALLVYGAGTATNLQARYAGADLAEPHHRGRAISTVLVATTVGAVVGPNLVTLTGDWAQAWGIPALAGPFMLAALAYGAAGAVIAARLRPDPLLLARRQAAPAPATAAAPAAGSPTTAGSPATAGSPVAFRTDPAEELPVAYEKAEVTPGSVWGTPQVLAVVVMVVVQVVMVAVMTMTPVHMKAHAHGLGATGLVIALHIAGMYLPSPLSGWLVDRYGPRVVGALAGFTLLLAGVGAAIAPVDSVPALAVALVLLGVGWSFGLVSGTTLLTSSIPLEVRARAQGTADLFIAVGGAVGGLGSGFVLTYLGFATLGWIGGALALVLVPAVVLAGRLGAGAGNRRQPVAAA